MPEALEVSQDRASGARTSCLHRTIQLHNWRPSTLRGSEIEMSAGIDCYKR